MLRKIIRKGLLMVAGCLMLSACGKEADKDNDALATPAGPISGGDTMGDGLFETEDNIVYLVVDPELAQNEPIYDEMTGYIMYRSLYYEITGEDGVRIPDYYDVDITEMDIPDEIVYEGKHYQVTEIGKEAFASMYGLEKVVLGNNIRTIQTGAFDNCGDLQEIKLDDNLKVIGDRAFNYCEMLSQVTLPEGITSIGEEAFCGCSGLVSINLPETLQVLGDNIFFDCENLESIILPASIGTVPYGMFTNCSRLANVEITDGILVIGKEVFWACESLTEIVIPKSVTYIADQAFYSSGLESVTFLGGSITLGEGLFDFCDDLATIYTSEASAEYYQSALEEYGTEFEIVK